MSLYTYMQKHHAEVLRRFFEDAGSIAAAVMDDERRIVQCNQNFVALTNRNEVKGLRLPEVVESTQGTAIALPPSGTAWKTTLRFRSEDKQSKDHEFHIFSHDGEYILLCDEFVGEDDPATATLAQLNQEMTNLNRELQKKTRALRSAKDTIEKLARTDELTDLANRRHFRDELETALYSSERHEFPVAICMADLDHFKTINDDFGHDMGDAVLQRFARILEEYSRKDDLPARWGGEEFIILMPHTCAEEGRGVAERIREKLKGIRPDGLGREVTASFGVTEFVPSENPDDLVNRADEALYQAKENGRDRVVVKEAPEGA